MYFRFDYMGIVLHICGTSLSVLLLEPDAGDKHKYGASALVIAGFATTVCLFFLHLRNTIRIAIIGGFGAMAFIVVLSLVTASGKVSSLASSYCAMVAINCVGGLCYVWKHAAKPSPRGHLLMHICSVIASIAHGLSLIRRACVV